MSLLLTTLMLASLPGMEGTIDYEIVQEGPRATVHGSALLSFTEDQSNPCLFHDFEIPEGRIAGPAISSNPGQPIIGFDLVRYGERAITIEWCKDSHPSQTLPCSLPRYFIFYVIRTEFGPDDLMKMLAEWGNAGSPWDLNHDGTVDGADLGMLLGGWKSTDGAST